MRKRYQRPTPRNSCIIETFLHMTPAGVKGFMKKRGLLKPEHHDTLRTSTKNTIKLYRGYIGIKYVNYNQKTRRLYVTRSWDSPKVIHASYYEDDY